jgi:hypothetical protein
MRKFFGPMGSVSRITVKSEARKRNCWVTRRSASSMCTFRLGTMEKDCHCLWTSSTARVAACRIPTCATRASRRRPRCRAGHDSP